MTPLKFRILPLVVLLAAGCAFADDSVLLPLAMPDANLVVGVGIDQAKAALVGSRYEQALKPLYDQAFKQEYEAKYEQSRQMMKSMLGFELKDLQEVVIAARLVPAPGRPQFLLMLRGPFNPDVPPPILAMIPTERTTYQGVPLVVTKQTQSKGGPAALAFLGNSILVAGDADSVRAAIARRNAAPGPRSPLLAQADEMSRKFHIWCVANDLGSAIPQGAALPKNASEVADALKNVEALNAGLLFTPGLRAAVNVTLRGEQDASALHALIGIGLQSAAQQAPDADAKDLLSRLQISDQGKTLQMSIDIPEEKVIEMVLAQAKKMAEKNSKVEVQGGNQGPSEPAPAASPNSPVVTLPPPK